MNVENIKRLRDTLIAERAKPHPVMGFNMGDLFMVLDDFKKEDGWSDKLDGCGTVACLAGWCYAIQHPELADKDGLIPIPPIWSGQSPINTVAGAGAALVEAREWLGLSGPKADYLFGLYMGKNRLKEVSLDDALSTLNYLLETGEVHWEYEDGPFPKLKKLSSPKQSST